MTLCRSSAFGDFGVLNEVACSFAEGPVGDRFRQAGIEPYSLDPARYRSLASVRRSRTSLGLLLDSTHPDVVVAHMSKPYGLWADVVRRRDVPIIFHSHGPMGWVVPRDLSDITAMARASPDAIVGCSDHARRTAQRSLRFRCPSYVWNNPLDWSFAAEVGPDRVALRQELAIAADDVVILSATRLDEWKGHEDLLRALGRLRELRGWAFVLAGGSERERDIKYLEGLRTLAASLGIGDRVRLLGARNDVPALMKCSDIYCQANRKSEGYSLSFAEALASGMPVVTTDIGSAREMITERVGTRVGAGNQKALAAALQSLILDGRRRQELSDAARAHILGLSEPHSQMLRFQRILEEVVARHSSEGHLSRSGRVRRR